MRKIVQLVIGIWLITGACTLLTPSGNLSLGGYESNGAKIYFTGINQRGERIEYVGGGLPRGMMMSQYLSCASCHAEDGKGGQHFMHMTVMDAPNIRGFSENEAGNGHDEEPNGLDEHALEHSSYGIDEFEMAVIFGMHPNGDLLSSEMPRWIMTDEDLKDLYEFLKNWE